MWASHSAPHLVQSSAAAMRSRSASWATAAQIQDGFGSSSTSPKSGDFPWSSCARTTYTRWKRRRALSTGGESIAVRASGFGLPSHQIDGQDIFAVHAAVTQAATRARAGDGPTFLEALTYRYKGHNSGEVVRYRTDEEPDLWRSSRDPIEHLIAELRSRNCLSDHQLAELRDRARVAIDQAVAYAEEVTVAGPLHRRRERQRLEQDKPVTGATHEATYSTAYHEGVAEEMERDATVFVLGTDLYDRGGHFSQVKGLGQRYGRDRIRDSPISEAAMIASGVGAALNRTRPIVDLNFMDFAYGAMDELINQAAKIRYLWAQPVPLVIRATAGVAQGGPQHNNSLQGALMGTPGLAVVFPATPWDVKGLIKSALRGSDPVIFMMHKQLTGLRGPVGDSDELVPIGSAKVVRQGTHVTIVTYGIGVGTSERAADVLAQEGIDVEILDLRTLAPLDVPALTRSVRHTGRVLVIDEAPAVAGPAAEIVAIINDQAFWYLDQPVTRLTAKHAPHPAQPAAGGRTPAERRRRHRRGPPTCSS